MKKLNSKEKKVKVKNYQLPEYFDCFNDANDLVGGFDEGEVVAIAGKNSIYRSILAKNLIYCFNELGQKMLLISTEEREKEIQQKIQMMEQSFCTPFNEETFFFEDESFDIRTIEGDIKKSKAKIVFVDCLQHLQGNIASNAEKLKFLAKKYKCIIFLMLQINNCVEGRMPDLSMLEQNNNVVRNLDQVWLFHDSELTNKSGNNLLILDIAKNVKGKMGKLWICLDADSGLVIDMDLNWYKRTWKAYQALLEEKHYPWAKELIKAIENIPSVKKEDSKKPLMILKSGIII